MSSLLDRIKVCGDDSLTARVHHALRESGKSGVIADVVAAVVKASIEVGIEAENVNALLGKAITDEEIIAYVATMQ